MLEHVLCLCCRLPVAAARCAVNLVPFTALLRLHPMSVAAAAGVLSPSALAGGTFSFLAYIFFQDLLCYGDLPAVKTKISVFVQLFCDCGLFFITAKRKWAADRLISYAFASRSVIGELATIPNRKKVAIQGVFLFLGPRDRFGRRWGWGEPWSVREQGGPESAVGAFRVVLGMGWFGCRAGRLLI